MRVLIAVALSAMIVACGASASPYVAPATPTPNATPTPDPAATAAALERAVEREYVAVLSDQLDRVTEAAKIRDRSGPGVRARAGLSYSEIKDEIDANDAPYRFRSCNSRVGDSLAWEIEAVELQSLVDAGDAPEGSKLEIEHLVDVAKESWTLAYDECRRMHPVNLPGLAWQLEAAFWRMGAVSAVGPAPTPAPTPRPTVDPRFLPRISAPTATRVPTATWVPTPPPLTNDRVPLCQRLVGEVNRLIRLIDAGDTSNRTAELYFDAFLTANRECPGLQWE